MKTKEVFLKKIKCSFKEDDIRLVLVDEEGNAIGDQMQVVVTIKPDAIAQVSVDLINVAWFEEEAE